MFDTRINELIMELGLNHVRHSKGFQLSGGEKDIEIARALSLNLPLFYLMNHLPVWIQLRFLKFRPLLIN